MIAIDLPGHGATPASHDSGTFAGLVGTVERYIADNELAGIDLVGSSMGARIVLELARRGNVGNVVALDPGGFWRGWERTFFKTTIGLFGRLLRAIRPMLPMLSNNVASRTALLAQLSAAPWALDPQVVATELASFSTTPTFDNLVRDLANGAEQTGPAADPTKRIVIGWGRHDRLCLPRQAARAKAAFPSAELYWFESSGHFPMWGHAGGDGRRHSCGNAVTYSQPYTRMFQTYVSPRGMPSGSHGQIEGVGFGKTTAPATLSRSLVGMTFDNAKFIIDNGDTPRRTCARAGTLRLQLHLFDSRTPSDLILTNLSKPLSSNHHLVLESSK